jgi:hypothetical protein
MPAEAEGEQCPSRLVPLGELGLVVLPGVVDAHWSAGLQHDAVHGGRPEHLLDQRQAVLLDIRRRRAQRVRVAVAVGVADDQVGMLAAEHAVVGQHDPGLDLETLANELALGIGEGVAVGVPGGGGGDQAMPAPRLLPDGHVARRLLRVVEAMLGVEWGGGPGRVIGRRDRHRSQTQGGGPGSSRRVPGVVPGIGVANRALQHGAASCDG